MRKDKVRAYQLRHEGKSYKEIFRLLGIPISTLASWLKDEEWSRKIRDNLGAKASMAFPEKLEAIQKANKARWTNKYKEYRTLAEAEFTINQNDPLFIAGLMLYWGKGNKSPKDSHIKLANSDPAMIRVFYNFLRRVAKIDPDKIKISLLLYPDLIDDMQKSFWSKAIGVPLSQFRKSTFIVGQHATRRLSYGVCNIWVSNRELKEKMIVWINTYQKILA